MKKFALLFVSIIFLAGCGWLYDPKDYQSEIIIKIVQTVYNEDSALNDQAAFLAIDLENVQGLSTEEKTEILDFFEETLEIPAIEATFEQLQKDGKFDEATMSLDGVLITITKLEEKWNNKVHFEAQKYRSGDGGFGIKGKVKTNEGEWRVVDVEPLWVS